MSSAATTVPQGTVVEILSERVCQRRIKSEFEPLKTFSAQKNGHLCPPIENDKSRSQPPKQNDLLNKKLAIFMTKEVSVMMILYCLDFSEAKSNLVYKKNAPPVSYAVRRLKRIYPLIA
ncbi:hypothetical protein [Lacticaseibacillus paracasei]|uniref:hypothetical protein n=1 Tax=Lacticaseibacillus paracasei TaxID=1597 RepID=UPI001CDB69A3|nr:hypothetical protein [Lacticaseibacillus paracasei]